MRTLLSLIDEATELCKGQSALARRLKVTPQRVYDWRNGLRPMTPETVAALCDLLQLDGEEARRLAALAVVENPKNAEIAQLLRRAFFVSWVAGAASVLLTTHDAHAMTTAHECDRSKIAAALLAWMARTFAEAVARIAHAMTPQARRPIAAAG